jgi:fructose-bisphosphate aldolase, class II
MIVTTARLYKVAYGKFAVGAYNINNMEQLLAKSDVERINAVGGKLDPSARGVNEEEYLPAAKLGVTKVNIDTDGRLVWTRVRREFFRDHPEKFDFRDPAKIFVSEYANFIAHKNEKLGSAGQLDAVSASVKAR